MTEDQPFELNPLEAAPATFDYAMFEHFIELQRRHETLYGPTLRRISGCEPLIHWLLRQFPPADPGATPGTLLGSIAIAVDDEVPLDSLRLTYADGTHKDIRVIDWMTGDWPVYNWPAPEDTYLPPQDGLRAALQRDATLGRPLLYDPDHAIGNGDPA